MTTNLSDLKRTLNLVCINNRLDYRLPDFFLLSDDQRLADPLKTVARMPRGSAIIVRHRHKGERRRLAFALKPVCRRREIMLFIANDIDLAIGCGADGIHFSEAAIWRNATRLRTVASRHSCHNGHHRPFLISAAAHCLNSALRAGRGGADVILLSPVFATRSHPEARTLGVLRITAITRDLSTPIYGLGGITGPNLKRLKNTGLAGLAGIEYFAKLLNKA